MAPAPTLPTARSLFRLEAKSSSEAEARIAAAFLLCLLTSRDRGLSVRGLPATTGLLLLSLSVTGATIRTTDFPGEALRTVRFTEGRLSDAPYLPCTQPHDVACGEARALRRLRPLALQTTLVGSSQAGITPRGAALSDVILSKSNDEFGTAINRLEQHSESVRDVKASNDLAVYYLQRGQTTDNALDLAKSLELLELLISDAESLPLEVRFNWALSLEILELTEFSEAAWTRYLEYDSSSAWAQEARQRLELIQARPDAPSTGENYFFVRPVQDRTSLAPTIDSFLRRLDQYWQDKGCTEARDSAQAIRELQSSDPNGLSQDLLLGLESLEAGFLAYQEDRQAEARHLLEEGAAALSRSDSMLELWAHFFLASSRIQREDFGGTATSLSILRKRLAGREAPRLEGHIDWLSGLVELLQGHPVEAHRHYRHAVKRLSLTEAKGSVATLQALQAEASMSLGRQGQAWDLVFDALQMVRHAEPKTRQIIFAVAANLAQESGLLATASRFQAYASLTSRSTGNSRLQVFSRLAEAQLAFRMGDLEAAKQNLEAARVIAADMGDEKTSSRVQADLAVVSSLWGESRLDALNDAISVYQGAAFSTQYTNEALEARARHHQRTGNLKLARDDWQASLELYEKRLFEGDLSPGARFHARGRLRVAYLQLIQLSVAAGRQADAFRTAERLRIASLASLDRSPMARQDPVEPGRFLEQTVRSVPPGWEVVTLTADDDGLHRWHLDSSGLQYSFKAVETRDLKQTIRAVVSSLSGGRWPEVDAKRLYTLLLPNTLSLDGLEGLVLVPDSSLPEVPYSILSNPASGQLLVEATSIVTASKLADLQIVAPKLDNANLVIFGDPAFSIELWPDLQPLPAARLETEMVASLYTSSALRIGEDATKPELFRLARGARLVHIAAHSRIDRAEPELSALAFAPAFHDETQDSGVVYQRDIYKLELALGAMVTLSSCESGKLTASEGEAASSLARAFLAAGASSVVSSIWSVDDQVTSKLMIDFHRQLRSGQTPSEALRLAQIQQLENDPKGTRWDWAAFRVLGSGR